MVVLGPLLKATCRHVHVYPASYYTRRRRCPSTAAAAVVKADRQSRG